MSTEARISHTYFALTLLAAAYFAGGIVGLGIKIHGDAKERDARQYVTTTCEFVACNRSTLFETDTEYIYGTTVKFAWTENPNITLTHDHIVIESVSTSGRTIGTAFTNPNEQMSDQPDTCLDYCPVLNTVVPCYYGNNETIHQTLSLLEPDFPPIEDTSIADWNKMYYQVVALAVSCFVLRRVLSN